MRAGFGVERLALTIAATLDSMRARDLADARPSMRSSSPRCSAASFATDAVSRRIVLASAPTGLLR